MKTMKSSKKGIKRFILLVLVVAIILIGVNLFKKSKTTKQSESTTNQSSQSVVPVDAQEVVEIAKDFLKKQEFANEYDLDSARVENYSQFWSIWFNKKDQNQKPNKGLVQVKKENNEAYWVEVY